MNAFHGRLFGPGLPGSGVAASASWVADGVLHLTGDGVECQAAAPTVAAGGFNEGMLRLDWQGEAGCYAFCVDDAAQRAACLAGAPPALVAALRAAAGRQARVERRFRFGWGVLVLLLLVPLLAGGALLLHLDSVADWAVAHIPADREAQLGELVLTQVRATAPIQEDGSAVELLRQVGTPLVQESSYRYRWLVVDAPSVNAFAAPGGIVVVHTGLLRAVATPEELAGVLAHEIAHAELRHSLKALVKSLGLRALAALLLGDLSASSVGEAAQHLAELGYSRDAEREADRDGLRRLVAAGIDPGGLLRFFALLEKEQPLAPPAFLSTHPATAERLTALREAVAGLSGDWRPLSVDLAGVQRQLGRGTAEP